MLKGLFENSPDGSDALELPPEFLFSLHQLNDPAYRSTIQPGKVILRKEYRWPVLLKYKKVLNRQRLQWQHQYSDSGLFDTNF